MKTITRIIAVVALITMPLVVNGQQKETQHDSKTETVKFSASITCDKCVNTIMNGLPKEKGVKDVKTDLESKTITVTYLKDKNSTELIKRSIEKLGFTAKLITDSEVKR